MEEMTPMKTSEAKRKQPSPEKAKAVREAAPARRVDKEAQRAPAEAPREKDAGPGVAIPNLASWGVSEGDARTHLGVCEDCGRAHRHVMKNPKDTMALDSFGRRIAVCLAGKQAAV
jgi:hypothetical protein